MNGSTTEVVTDSPPRLAPAADPRPGRRRALAAATVAAFAVPVAWYLAFIARYGVNVIWGDQWAAVRVVGHSYDGTLSFGTLWQQINQERMLVPNLFALALAHATRFNLFVEMYASSALLFGSVLLVCLAHRRRSPGRRWLWYAPVAVLMLSVVQYENTLAGFQIGWYIILFCLAAVVYLLDSPRLTWAPYGLAVVAALAGTFSSIQGLILWACGLVLLVQRRRSGAQKLVWLGAAVFAFAAHFYKYDFKLASPNSGFAFHHLWLVVQVYFTEIGDTFGFQVSGNGDAALLGLGVVLFVAAVAVLVLHGLRTDTTSARPVAVALLVFGLVFPFFAAMGNISYGLGVAGLSRMTTYDLLVLVGCYLALLDRRATPAPTAGRDRPAQALRSRAAHAIVTAVGLLMAVVIPLQAVAGTANGISGGRTTHRERLNDVDVLAGFDTLPRTWAAQVVYLFGSPDATIAAVAVAQRRHLSVFSSKPASIETRGILLQGWAGFAHSPLTPWRNLHDGEVVRLDVAQLPPNAEVVVTECSGEVVYPDHAVRACSGGTDVHTSTDGRGRLDVRFPVRLGPIGTGSCDARHACFIGVWKAGGLAPIGLAEFTAAR